MRRSTADLLVDLEAAAWRRHLLELRRRVEVLEARREESKVIQKQGGGYAVKDSSGKKTLGKHKTKAEAERQLRAIEANKARRK
jgi:hypothetical protein